MSNITTSTAKPMEPLTRTQSSSQINTPNKTEAPKTPEVTTPKSSPELFKKTKSETESSEVAQSIQATPPAKMGETHQMLKSSGATEEIMADKSLPSLADMSKQINNESQMRQWVNSFKAKFFTPTKSDVTYDKTGKLDSSMKMQDILLMKHNPLASAKAKEESEMFRAFTTQKERSIENTPFMDDMYKFSQMDPTKPEADAQLKHLHDTYISLRSPKEINIPSAQRTELTSKYTEFTKAKQMLESDPSSQNQARYQNLKSDLIQSLEQPTREIQGLLVQPYGRFTTDPFRSDIQATKKTWWGRAKYVESRMQGKTEGMQRATRRDMKENVQAYRNHLREQRLSTPQGQRREQITQMKEAASGHKRGTVGFAMYDTFVAPWKTWKTMNQEG